jgi:hypothetical protein
MTTPYQISLLHHTLGLNERRREPYRNHFVAGDGHHDMYHLSVLERAGLMERRATPKFLEPGDIVFAVTEAGREVAIAALPEPKPPAKRTRYEDYLDADGCGGDSFGEYLCGRGLPEFETQREFKRDPSRPDVNDLVWVTEHRMYRLRRNDWSFSRERDVQGEWCITKKEAKASYKAALKAYKEGRKR